MSVVENDSDVIGYQQEFTSSFLRSYGAKTIVYIYRWIGRRKICGVPCSMLNRHGLITGATGTGKTVTLQVFAEQLSQQGISVFAADVKGDLSGIAEAGKENEKMMLV